MDVGHLSDLVEEDWILRFLGKSPRVVISSKNHHHPPVTDFDHQGLARQDVGQGSTCTDTLVVDHFRSVNFIPIYLVHKGVFKVVCDTPPQTPP